MSLDPRLAKASRLPCPARTAPRSPIIDMQNCFCQPEGLLRQHATDKKCAARGRACVRGARGRAPLRCPVIHVIQSQLLRAHPDDRLPQRPAHRGLMLAATGTRRSPTHCSGSRRAGIEKLAYSAFPGTAFDMMLQRLGVRQLAIIGVTTSICVEFDGTRRRAARLTVYVAPRRLGGMGSPRATSASIEQIGYAFAASSPRAGRRRLEE